MKPTRPHEKPRQPAGSRRRSVGGTITRFALTGGIAATIVGATIEALAALVTGTWPSGTAHLLAALLALVIGCIAMVIVALSALVRGVEVTVSRLGASVHTISTSVAGATDAAITLEQQRASTAKSGGMLGMEGPHSHPPHASHALSGLLNGVEHDGKCSREPEHAVLAGSP